MFAPERHRAIESLVRQRGRLAVSELARQLGASGITIRRDLRLLEAAGFSEPPRSWQQWSEMLAGIARRAPPGRHAVLLPLNEFEPLLALALQQEDPLLREDGRWGNFSTPGFRRTLAFYLEMFRRGWAPTATSTSD